MFVKFLVFFLFSNVYVSFSVLMCSKSLTEKCGFRVEIIIGVPVSAIERTDLRLSVVAIKCMSASALEPKRPRSSVLCIHPRYPHSPSPSLT
jgi:hypothetical protein